MNKILTAAFIAAVLVGALLYNNDAPDEAMQVVDRTSLRHLVTGDVVGFADAYDSHAWLGLPFSRPPVGEQRWKAPRPPEVWKGTREALSVGAPCVQFWGDGMTNITDGEEGEVVGSEDCLYLNVWSPSFAVDAVPTEDKRLPVMFWIHGGGNSAGTANTYKGHHLAGGQDVIVVAINYRLGGLGWFGHPALRNTSDNTLDASGNYGILDMIQGLQWVQSNIASFGGDPDNVTIFGESAGGHDVLALLVSPLAKGLFHRAIAQSGSINTLEKSRAENYIDDVEPGEMNSSREVIVSLLQADQVAVDREQAKTKLATMTDKKISEYLRSKSPEQILATYAAGSIGGMYMVPVQFRDGTVIPTEPMIDLFASPQRYNSVPVILGSNRDEQKFFMAGNPDYVDFLLGTFPQVKDHDAYNRESAYHSDMWKALAVDEPAKVINAAKDGSVYAYRFDWDESAKNMLVDFAELFGAGHAMELDFVFGTFGDDSALSFLYNAENQPGREQLSKAMMSYWAQFAYTGNPGRGRENKLPEWGAWGSVDGDFMVFDTDAGGGLSMNSDGISVESLKERLLADSQVEGQQELCRRYVTMFFLSWQSSADFWDEEEYASLGEHGCTQYVPSELVSN